MELVLDAQFNQRGYFYFKLADPPHRLLRRLRVQDVPTEILRTSLQSKTTKLFTSVDK